MSVIIMQACRKRSEVTKKHFICAMCDYSSPWAGNTRRHMLLKHRIQPPSHWQPLQPPQHPQLSSCSQSCLKKEPTLACMQKPYLPPNTSFQQWVQTPGNIYIGGRAKKYCPPGYTEESMWTNTKLLRKLYRGDISRAEFLEQYETWVRNHMMKQVFNLSDKVLGCWCTNFEECHGNVLKKVWLDYKRLNTVHSLIKEHKLHHEVRRH